MIYLDHHATTPVAPEVVEIMVQALRDLPGNPGSVHTPGRAARAAVDQARRRVAALLGCREREVVFTSGGTEANNLALRGAWFARQAEGRRRVVTTAVEHPAVLNTVRQMEELGAEVVVVPVTQTGALDRAAFAASLDASVAVVSVMMANNETGVVFPVAELAAEAQACGAWFHVDAVQAAGRLALDVGALGVDLLSISGHKVRGPKGVGALFVRRGLAFKAIQHGGNQERGYRSGTENTLGIVGFGRAAELAQESLIDEASRQAQLRDRFEQAVVDSVEGVRIHGAGEPRLPSVTNLGFDQLEGEAALLALDMEGVYASSGSACASGSLEPSHVLLAMGYTAEQAHGSIRFSVGHETTQAQLEQVLEVLSRQVPKLRQLLIDPLVG
jgi:cysteine desulfurase